MDRGLFFLNNDEINKAAEQLLVCLATAKDAAMLRVDLSGFLTPEQARVGVAVALTALTGCNFMPDNAALISMSGESPGQAVTWPPRKVLDRMRLERVADRYVDEDGRDTAGAGPRHG